jgi:cytochrome-b5 reductase
MEYKSKVLFTEFVTHDVKRFIIEKPHQYQFIPGQATELAINRPKWKNKPRPFTFTSLNEDKVLQFIIKKYPEHHGVTEKLHQLKTGDELILKKPFGTINYKGQGVFLAGGAGITPFIAILRKLAKENKLADNQLYFSNKKQKDVILEKEFKHMLGDNLKLFLTREEKAGYLNTHIDKQFLSKNISDISQKFYVCGPPGFVKSLRKSLQELGADTEELVFEGK